MFCRKCGTEIKEGTIFCSNCGENINRINEASAPNIQTSNEKAVGFINSIIAIFVNIFAKGPKYVLTEHTTKKGFEWVALTILSILTCGLGLTVNINQLIGEDISSYLGYAGLNFGTMFGLNLLTSIVSIFVPITIIWLLLNVVCKSNIGYTVIANVYSIAFIPVSICYIVNMLIGCIYAPLAIVILLVMIIYGFALLNYTIEKLMLGKNNDAIYLITVFATVLLTLGTWFLSYKETVSSIISSIF